MYSNIDNILNSNQEVVLSNFLNDNGELCEYKNIDKNRLKIAEMYNGKTNRPTYSKELIYISDNKNDILEVYPVIKLMKDQVCIGINGYQLKNINGEWRFYYNNQASDSYYIRDVDWNDINDVYRIVVENGKYIEKNGINCYKDFCRNGDLENVSVNKPNWYCP